MRLSRCSIEHTPRQPNPALHSDPACIAFPSLSATCYPGFVQRLGAGGAGELHSLGQRHRKRILMNDTSLAHNAPFRITIKPAILLCYALSLFIASSVFFSFMSMWSDGAGNQRSAHFWLDILGTIIVFQFLILFSGWKNSYSILNRNQKIIYSIISIPLCFIFIYFIPTLGFLPVHYPVALVASFLLYKNHRSKSTFLLLTASIFTWLYPFIFAFIPPQNMAKSGRYIQLLSIGPEIQWVALLWFSISLKPNTRPLSSIQA